MRTRPVTSRRGWAGCCPTAPSRSARWRWSWSPAPFDWVILDKARFAGEAVFLDASFQAEAHFIDIEFRRAAFDRAEFTGVRFGAAVDFAGARFEVNASSHAPPPFVSFAGAMFARGVPPEVAPWLSSVDV